MSDAIGIVGVRFLNARPLLAGLEAGIEAPFPYRFEAAEPSVCAERLARGESAAGLVPVAALPVLDGVIPWPELGIACRHETTSVLLVSHVAPERIATLAAHTASHTSIALARLLLAEKWGVRPEVVPASPPLETMLGRADAAVLIGDPAFKVHGRTGLREIDLAAAWVEWTGLPFVFAVWGVRREAPDGLGDVFHRSLAYAEGHWDRLIPAWASIHGVAESDARRYLEQALCFRVGEAERAGMDEFLRRARESGVLPSREAVWRLDA